MRLRHISIRNILGIDELEFDTGKFTLIDGRNGSGKTSVIEALKALGRGGVDATLLRAGAKEGEIVWLFDDGSQVRKRISGSGVPTVSFKDSDGRQVTSPQAAVDALVDMLSMNPVAFLLAEPKRRIDVLIDSLRLKADDGKIRDIVGDPTFPIVDGDALRKIDCARTIIFDDRTGTNRAAREKEATISQLRATLPANDDAAPAGDDKALLARLGEIDAVRDGRLSEIDAKLEGYRAEHDAAVQACRDEIARLQAVISQEVQSFSETKSRAAGAKAVAISDHAAARADPAAALAAIHTDRDAIIRARTTRETVVRLETEAESLRQDGEHQTSVIDALDAYKTELLSALPIDGLEVRDGQIFRHDVVFDRLNKAQQVEIAIEIAKLRAGDLKVVCVDELERLDTEHFESFRDQALASGLQLIVTRVSDGDFSIRSEG